MNGFYWKVIQRGLNKKSLTDWERKFLTDLNEKGEDYELSDEQTHKLNEVGGRP